MENFAAEQVVGKIGDMEPGGQLKRSKHPRRSLEEKRRIVEETLVPGVSVASIARAHGIHPTQIFDWRRRYRKGGLKRAEEIKKKRKRLLPVRVMEEKGGESRWNGNSESRGRIEIRVARGEIRVEGSADRETLEVILEGMLK